MLFPRFLRQTSIFKHRRYCGTSSITWTERILSGIQPTGMIHLGNYLGAIRCWVDLQNTGGNVMCSVVDLHAMTQRYDFKQLPDNILKMVASILACGIDPEKSIIFLQSEVPEHTQLCWVLQCLCTSTRLARMPQYREKSSDNTNIMELGLYVYPILQAADILIHQATKVPVGVDQLQHLQLARELARKFNHVFGETFPEPNPLVTDAYASKIKDLRDPSKKMSKSSSLPRGRIEITDSPDEILKKVKRALTDFTSAVTFDPVNRPGVSNLISIHSALINRTPEEICDSVEHLDTGQYKLVVAEVVIEALKPIRKEVEKLSVDKTYLRSVLQKGADAASCTASETWKLVRERTGIHARVSS